MTRHKNRGRKLSKLKAKASSPPYNASLGHRSHPKRGSRFEAPAATKVRAILEHLGQLMKDIHDESITSLSNIGLKHEEVQQLEEYCYSITKLLQTERAIDRESSNKMDETGNYEESNDFFITRTSRFRLVILAPIEVYHCDADIEKKVVGLIRLVGQTKPLMYSIAGCGLRGRKSGVVHEKFLDDSKWHELVMEWGENRFHNFKVNPYEKSKGYAPGAYSASHVEGKLMMWFAFSLLDGVLEQLDREKTDIQKVKLLPLLRTRLASLVKAEIVLNRAPCPGCLEFKKKFEEWTGLMFKITICKTLGLCTLKKKKRTTQRCFTLESDERLEFEEEEDDSEEEEETITVDINTPTSSNFEIIITSKSTTPSQASSPSETSPTSKVPVPKNSKPTKPVSKIPVAAKAISISSNSPPASPELYLSSPEPYSASPLQLPWQSPLTPKSKAKSKPILPQSIPSRIPAKVTKSTISTASKTKTKHTHHSRPLTPITTQVSTKIVKTTTGPSTKSSAKVSLLQRYMYQAPTTSFQATVQDDDESDCDYELPASQKYKKSYTPGEKKTTKNANKSDDTEIFETDALLDFHKGEGKKRKKGKRGGAGEGDGSSPVFAKKAKRNFY